MDFLRDFFQKHKRIYWAWIIFAFAFFSLPQWLDAAWSLAERISGSGVTMPDITWAFGVTVPVGLVMFGIAIWAVRSKKTVEVKPEVVRSETIEMDRRTSSLPNIELWGSPYIDKRTIRKIRFIGGEGERAVTWNPYFAHIKFCNNPSIRSSESEAREVVAEIEYFDKESNHVLGPIHGRWGDTTQPGHLPPSKSTRDLLEVNFAPNGLPRELDIALKYIEDEECYAFNNDSCYQTQDWKLPDYILRGEIFKINVKLKGIGVDDEWWFQLQNKGKDGGLSIDIIQ